MIEHYFSLRGLYVVSMFTIALVIGMNSMMLRHDYHASASEELLHSPSCAALWIG